MNNALPRYLIRDVVARALAEDLGGRGDITTLATVPEAAEGRFRIVARHAGVLAGVEPAAETFFQIDPHIEIEWREVDGDPLEPGSVIAELAGPAGAILGAERTALNFLGRLSGIASLTRRYVDAVAGSGAGVAHTRKTTPGLRALELQAVAAGGGVRHRFGLDDAILIKDNHVAVAGSVGEAVRRARAYAGHMVRVATEIDRLEQLDEALDAGADGILLDNFGNADLRQAVMRCKGRGVTLEASGNVSLDTIGAIAATGVDIISIGALTHSANCLDLGLDEHIS
ncbi:carboxylating nicotinate-nucleotide diphosphorylase [Wenzhouxiangella sediminis]|uniref:Probable nicotinate-nucleotide pyrophosphorylase [carboxylating] n=1 Tax=Wenzhouxiangella sediminis TaxID=1792836 RepID=A0A3E1K689_9GAMM|nr:carboxylating nicotinate-nucleotide diphosphorylase [Wenzhouxiangella sediminis]RFF29470.1 carboxylating nicotinate-nucleotide diphosphorylase [Wenzhouxiangella sediminis]